MKTRLNLRQRIILSFIAYSVFFSMLFGSIIFFSVKEIEDYLFDQRVKDEMAFFINHFRNTGELPKPSTPFITMYLDRDGVPKDLAPQIEQLPMGIHELENEDVHVGIARLPGTDTELCLLYNVHSLEMEQSGDVLFTLILLLTTLALTGTGILIGISTSSRIIRPVTELATAVENITPENLPETVPRSGTDDEVSVLADALQMMLNRIHQFVERERQFTRFVSHELRSPVTVIRGATELLESQIEPDSTAGKPLTRIHRAISEMESTLGCFLLLSREQIDAGSYETFSVRSIVRDLLAHYEPMLMGRTIDVRLEIDGEMTLHTHLHSFRIAVGNLMRNAFQFTSSGTVTIASKPGSLTVSDTGSGIDPEIADSLCEPFIRSTSSPGHGLGLSIVQAICRRFSWTLEIRSGESGGTDMTVHFGSQETAV